MQHPIFLIWQYFLSYFLLLLRHFYISRSVKQILHCRRPWMHYGSRRWCSAFRLRQAVYLVWHGRDLYSASFKLVFTHSFWWLRTFSRSPNDRVPWWLLTLIRRFPLILLVKAVACLSLGLMLVAYTIHDVRQNSCFSWQWLTICWHIEYSHIYPNHCIYGTVIVTLSDDASLSNHSDRALPSSDWVSLCAGWPWNDLCL